MIKVFSVMLLSILYGVMTLGQERYKDSIFSDIELKTFTYSDTLQLDLYTPKKDTLLNRPLLLLVHGGGFSIGKRNNPRQQKFCIQMAHRGYAAASISYRLTRKGKSFGCDCPASEKIKTFRLATEDVLKAVNFLTERDKELGINTSKVVLVGSSAGAEAVLNSVFMRHHHDFKDLPFPEEKFIGVVSFAGAVMDIDYVTEETKVPTLLYHGQKDKLVPFGTAPHHYCDTDSSGYLILAGSSSIAKKLKELDTPYDIRIDPQGNHKWANLPYDRVDEIAGFVKEVILDGKFRQTKIHVNEE